MREKILFDDNWLFHKGDIDIKFPLDKGPVYAQSKTERMMWGPASRCYKAVPDNYGYSLNTDLWEYVTIPHDYVIDQKPSKNENNALGFFEYENAWYRKIFKLSPEDKNKRITLIFDGVATHATVYVNGCLMKHNFCGYTTFEVDITDVVDFGETENLLAVYVETNSHEGWWYEGGGIYRHVWLKKTDLIAVDLWGFYVSPEKINDTLWNVRCETTILNDRYEDADVEYKTVIRDADGNHIGEASGRIMIPLREKKKAIYNIRVEAPILWDTENPYLYAAETVISSSGNECDIYKTRTGFRTFEIDPDKGLFLNGRHIKIKGVCAHQDFGLTGKAVPDNIHRYKVEMIKEMGANGYRTSHYPQTEAIMDALDELGFIVMDETRWFESTDEGKQQLEMLIKRDRNRPSVLFWSIGNEEPHHITETGRRICKNLMAFVRKLDNTRFITTAVSHPQDLATVHDEVDVIGINYNITTYERIHKKYPNKAIVSSECCATGSVRGWYDDANEERAFATAYDTTSNTWFRGREETWKFMSEREWVVGSYQWDAFEHRGETLWPRLCSISGAIDLYLQKKDAFYQNQSHWIETKPIVHLLPHWNFKGREGEPIRVCAYTNCEELELYLNGVSLGKRQIERFGHGEWLVEYKPGVLTVAARRNGETVCTDSRETSGSPVSLKLRLENKISCANGKDVAVITCFCTDEQGREVPTATPFVSFNANKLGKVIGTGSDITDHNPVSLPDRRMRAGRITAAVLVGKQAGNLKVYASAENLKGAVLTIPLSND